MTRLDPFPEPELAGASGGGSAALLEQAADAADRGWKDDDGGRSQWSVVRRRFTRHKLAVVALLLLVLVGLAAVFADQLARFPLHPDLTDPEVLAGARQSPSADHWFGTDKLGVDQLTRVLFALRVSLAVGFGTALLATVVGTVVGALAGYYGRWLDATLMRVTDLLLLLPTVAVMLVMADRIGNSVAGMIVVLSLLSWMPMARIVRGEFLSLREQEFVEAARASGASGPRIIVRHLLPNVVGPIVVFATLLVGLSILTEALLSFLGAGIQLPDVSLGNLISEAESTTGTSLAYLIYFPGLVLFLIVLCVNYVGDGLRDALDPRGAR